MREDLGRLEVILAEDCQNLIKSMPKRVQAVLRQKGAILNTKYTLCIYTF